MSTLTWSTGVFAISLVTAACSYFQTKEGVYLDSVKGRATQAEVRQHLGDPKTIQQDKAGHTVWVYELPEQQAGNRFTAPGVWCEQYLLTFDEQAVFTRWTQLSHFHGGELMPDECIPPDEEATGS